MSGGAVWRCGGGSPNWRGATWPKWTRTATCSPSRAAVGWWRSSTCRTHRLTTCCHRGAYPGGNPAAGWNGGGGSGCRHPLPAAARSVAGDPRRLRGRLLRRHGGRSRAAEGFQQGGFHRPRVVQMAFLDRAKAPDVIRDRGDLDGQTMVVMVQTRQKFAQRLLVVGYQLALHLPLRRVAERVEAGAAQTLHPGEHLEGLQHPGTIGLLLRLSRRRVDLRQHGRGQMELQLVVALELLAELLQEGAVGVEPGDLVLVLVGQQLEVVAGDSLGQAGQSAGALALDLADPVDLALIAGGI